MTREQAIDRIMKDLSLTDGHWRDYVERTLDRLGIGEKTDLYTAKTVEQVIRDDFTR